MPLSRAPVAAASWRAPVPWRAPAAISSRSVVVVSAWTPAALALIRGVVVSTSVKSSAFVELVPIVALAVTTFASSTVVLPLPPVVELAVVTSSIVVEVVAVAVVVVPRASREAGPVFLVLVVNCIDPALLEFFFHRACQSFNHAVIAFVK